jgi:hypothetical protein
MIAETWRALGSTWGGYLSGARLVLPKLLCMLTVVAAGWLVATVLRRLLQAGHRATALAGSGRAGRTAELLRQADLPPADRLVAGSAYWAALTVSLLAGLDCLGFDTLRTLREGAAVLMPRAAVALAILLGAAVVANVVAPILVLAAVNAGWRSGHAVNVGVRALTLATGAAMAFDHLGVARSVVLTGFAISYGSLMLALALSVGIGASGAVQRRIDERLATAAAPPRTVARSSRP